MSEPLSRGARQRLAVYGCAVEDRRVLLARGSVRSSFSGRWWLPGGGIEFGETPAECLIREFNEETGLAVEPVTLTQAVSDVTDSPSGGRVHSVRLLYTVRVCGGSLSADLDETTDMLEWYDLEEAAGLPLMPFVRLMLFGPSR